MESKGYTHEKANNTLIEQQNEWAAEVLPDGGWGSKGESSSGNGVGSGYVIRITRN